MLYESKTIVRHGLAEQVAAQIERLISEGKLAAGERLPSERKLSELFKVSRVSIREAINQLEQRGLLERRPGSGTYTQQIPKTLVAESIDYFYRFSKCSHMELLDARAIFEPEIAARAALNATAEDLAALEEHVAQIERAWPQENPEVPVEPDVRFHEKLAEASGNSLLYSIALGLHKVMRAFLMAQNKTRFSREAAWQHRQILEAVAARDAESARRLMSEHIALARKTAPAPSRSTKPKTGTK